MPVYLYRCQNCFAVFEKRQLFSDQPLTRCPECHLKTIQRIPQLPAVIFKGSGWYSIDHRSLSNRKINTTIKKNGKTGSIGDKESKR